MNIHASASAGAAAAISPAEWQARVDLAAVYRLVARHGWDDVIYNHCSMRAPGEDRKFLMKRHRKARQRPRLRRLARLFAHARPHRSELSDLINLEPQGASTCSTSPNDPAPNRRFRSMPIGSTD
jgi:hypothetical protein